MKAYSEIIQDIIKTDKAQNLLIELNNKESKMLARLKAENELKKLMGSELKKVWREELQVPNINNNGKTFVNATFFNPHEVASFEMKSYKVRA